LVPVNSSGPLQVYFLMDTTDEKGQWTKILYQLKKLLDHLWIENPEVSQIDPERTFAKLILIARYPFEVLDFPWLKKYSDLLKEPPQCYLSEAFQKLDINITQQAEKMTLKKVLVFTILLNSPGGKTAWTRYIDKVSANPNISLHFVHIAGFSKIKEEFEKYIRQKPNVSYLGMDSSQLIDYVSQKLFGSRVSGNQTGVNPSPERALREHPGMLAISGSDQKLSPEAGKKILIPGQEDKPSQDAPTQASKIVKRESPEPPAKPNDPDATVPELPQENPDAPMNLAQISNDKEQTEGKPSTYSLNKGPELENSGVPAEKLPDTPAEDEKNSAEPQLVIDLLPPVVLKDGVAAIWQNLEPDPSLSDRVPHELKKRFPIGKEWEIIAASRRGKMHAHKGSFREDAYAMGEANGWQFIVVADGGGSRTMARVGSNLAANTAINRMKQVAQEKENLAKVSLEGLAELILRESGQAAYEALQSAALERNLKTDDFGTTFLALAFYPNKKENIIGVLQVGDGLIAALMENQEFTILADPDVGESAAQTMFLTSKPWEEWSKRIHFVELPSPPVMIVSMCDGVSDDMIPYSKNLPILFKVLIEQVNEDRPEEVLLKFLGYERRGSFDDRTLVFTYHKKSLDEIRKQNQQQVKVENRAQRSSSPFDVNIEGQPGS
jgi:hypothetical protein